MRESVNGGGKKKGCKEKKEGGWNECECMCVNACARVGACVCVWECVWKGM